MGKATKIMRASLHAFFKNYHPAASATAFLLLPFSAMFLLSHSSIFSSSKLLISISGRLRPVFKTVGFPPSSQFLFLLNAKLSQSIFSFITTLPFSLITLLAKASIVQHMHSNKKPFSSILHLYPSLMKTQAANFLALIASNAAVFSLLFLAFSIMEVFHFTSDSSILVLSAAGVTLYSILLTNAVVACKLATVITAAEGGSGFHAVLKALLLVRGHTSTAVTVALPVSIGITGVEALFQFRVVKAYKISSELSIPILCEGLLISYILSIIFVLDTIITCMVYNSCKPSQCGGDLLHLEEGGSFRDYN